jgi:molybdopterin converting factor small subunit
MRHVPDYISIDQNSNTLWDTVPKLAALSCHGLRGMHCFEDIDMAFTRRGIQPGDPTLAVVRERYYRGGVSDWGATLFYSDFLGRQPLDVADLEPYTGWTTAALSRRLDCSVDDLYDRYSPSDNWQLVGASYAGDSRFHRTIGDLQVGTITPHLRQLLDHLEEDLLARFPELEARRRIENWVAEERSLVERLCADLADAPLTELYWRWVEARIPAGTELTLTSDVFSLAKGRTPMVALLERFVADYEQLAGFYNQAVEETDVGVHPLHVSRGELPFFVVAEVDGRLVRTAASLEDGDVVAGDWRWPVADGQLPLDQMWLDGVECLAGKALLLVLQVRLAEGGCPLALPHLGSLYMPAAYALERKLRDAGVVEAAPHPVRRVRLRFFEAWKGCQTLVGVPDYLAGVFSADELPAERLATEIVQEAQAAEALLESLKEKEGRDAWQAANCAERAAKREALELARREMVQGPHDKSEVRALYEQVKELDRELLQELTDAVVRAMRVRDLLYYYSRGALLPWSVALGGQSFYERLLEQAEIQAETADDF